MFEEQWFEGQVGVCPQKLKLGVETFESGGGRKVEGEQGISCKSDYVGTNDGASVQMLFFEMQACIEVCSFSFFCCAGLKGEASGLRGGGSDALLCEVISFYGEKMKWDWYVPEGGPWECGEPRG